jgi:hypothetical protein
MRDEESFQIYSKKCAEFYKGGNYPALVAKYDKLMQRARKAELVDFTHMSQVGEGIENKIQNKFAEMVSSVLMECQGRDERAQRSLRLILRESNSSVGYLYIMQEDGPSLCAFEGGSPPTAEMDSVVRFYIQAETGEAGDVTMTVADLKEPTRIHFNWPRHGEQEYRPVIVGHNTEEGFAITGLAVLCVDPNREFNLPGEALAALSKSLSESGDAVTVYAL